MQQLTTLFEAITDFGADIMYIALCTKGKMATGTGLYVCCCIVAGH